MSIKISFMYYVKWARLMSPVVFKEFKLVCTFLLFFSIHYHFQLVKGQLQQNSGGVAAPPPPSPPGFYGPEIANASALMRLYH